MEKNLCKKCGKELPENVKDELCEDCKKERRNKRIKNAVMLGTTVTGVVAGGIYVNKHPEIIEKMTKVFDKLPSLLDRDRAKESDVPAAGIIKNESRNYLTDIDRQKIEKARSCGIFTDNMIKRAKTAWEMGLSSVDELLRTWQAYDIINAFPRWTEQVKTISKAEFNDILAQVKEDIPDIADIKAFNDTVQVMFKSRSGKSKWPAYFRFFNEDGELTSDCIIDTPYENAGVVRTFADTVRKHMKYLVETR